VQGQYVTEQGTILSSDSVWQVLLANQHAYTSSKNLLLLNCAMLIDLSLIWSALGLMSRQGLFPIPIEDISARRISVKLKF
jgi:hypothetical protein